MKSLTLVAAATCVLGLVGCRVAMDADEERLFPTTPLTTQLTFGSGNDTEAAWSPTGGSIAFQTDRDGDMDICLLDVETGRVSDLVVGPGDACFPAWSPDGAWLAYSYRGVTYVTAEEETDDGCNIFVIPSGGGASRQLTYGRHRDLTPTFDASGARIVFASTRGADKQGRVRLYSVPFAGGEPTLFHGRGGKIDATLMQPTFSPGGRHYAAGFVLSLRDNWSIVAGLTETPGTMRRLGTNVNGPLYGPRWSPLANGLVACTGYEAGTDGWGIYLVQVFGEEAMRVTDGTGNSRSPSWSPDGTSLVFESNGSGRYKLYRTAVPAWHGPGVDSDPLALVPRVTASTGAGSAPAAFDGMFADDSHWFCVGLNQWIEAAFTVPRRICGVRVHSGYLGYVNNPSGAQGVAGYRVQAWVDGVWRDLGQAVTGVPRYDGGGRDRAYTEALFSAVTAARFRLLLTASHDTLRRVRSPDKACVPPDKAATYVREVVFLETPPVRQ